MRGGFFINKRKSNIILVVILTIFSFTIYFIQNLNFHRPEETFFYLLQDLAFVPIQVAIVTFIINRFLNIIEQRKKTKKINVIISTFFTEVGISIMTVMSEFNRNNIDICNVISTKEIKKSNQNQIRKLVKAFKYNIYADPDKLDKLALLLTDKKAFMLSLLENSNLMEHDSFTDMLWAVFHVTDELQSRGNLRNLSKEDINHLSSDLLRAFSAIVLEWIDYIFYLHDEYPFLYELAKKKNPFDQLKSNL